MNQQVDERQTNVQNTGLSLEEAAKEHNDKVISQMVKDYNQRFAVARWGARMVVIDESQPEAPMDFKAFRELTYNETASLAKVGRGELVFEDKPAAELWLRHKDCRKYDRVVFNPAKAGHTEDAFNLFQGLPIEPAKSNWSLMQDHILNVIASGNQEHYEYILDWMAYPLQNLGKRRPGVCLCMTGAQGTGKGIFAHFYGRLFGKHFNHILSQGGFTDKFNYSLATAIMVFIDEAIWAGDKTQAGRLKGMLTEPTLEIEMKFKDKFKVDNHLWVMIASNHEWHAPVEITDRRFASFEVSDRRRGDKAYFDAIAKQMENGGLEGMLFDLLRRDLSQVNLMNIPETEARMRQKIHTLDPEPAFILHILMEGSQDGEQEWKDEIPTKWVHDHFERFALNRNRRASISSHKLGWAFKKYLKDCVYKPNSRVRAGKYSQDNPSYVYRFDSLDKCREVFYQTTGIKAEDSSLRDDLRELFVIDGGKADAGNAVTCGKWGHRDSDKGGCVTLSS